MTDDSVEATVRAAVCGKADVTLIVRDASGKTVLKDVLKGVSGEYRHAFTLRNPHLWNGLEDPYLYTVELRAGGDRAVTEVGFRYYSPSGLPPVRKTA